MSVFRLVNKLLFSHLNIAQNSAISNHNRFLSVSFKHFCAETPTADKPTAVSSYKDRTKIIPVDISIKYLNSEAYKTTYGDKFIWEQYRRNHKGIFPPKRTRKTCIRQGLISTGSQCPICRDEYLVIDYQNLDLIKQFISPHTGNVLSYSKTGVCQKNNQQLLIAIEKAMDYGLITFNVPFRRYDYEQYYGKSCIASLTNSNKL